MKNLADLFVTYKQLSTKIPIDIQKPLPNRFIDYLNNIQTTKDRVQKIEVANEDQKFENDEESEEIVTRPVNPTVPNPGNQETEKGGSVESPESEFPSWWNTHITTPNKEYNVSRFTNKLDANAKYAYNYFIQNGLSRAAAAGIVGNLYHENLANPSQTVNDSRGTTALGIAGFNSKGDLPNLQKWCRENGLKETDFDAQLAYLTNVVKSGRVKLNDPNLTPEQASFIFGRDFERFAGRDGRGYQNYDDPEHIKRRKTALRIYQS